MAPLEKITTPTRELLADNLALARRENEILRDKNRNLRQTIATYAEEHERLKSRVEELERITANNK